jgi:hypothetical protein
MKLEKKLILCSIVAITIGIATIVPMAYFMNAPVSAQTTDENPWFNLNISYATVGVTNPFGENLATYCDVYNYTVNPDAIDTQVGSRTECYRLQIYSDEQQLVNKTAYLQVNCTEFIEPYGIQFAREGWFNITGRAGTSGTFSANFNGTFADIPGAAEGFSAGDADQIQAIQNAQTVYIDIHRVGYITTKGNSTVATLANDEVIQHLELTRSGDQFVYGIKPFGYVLDQVP